MEPVELLHRMVEIESLSRQEQKLAEFLTTTMDSLGFDAHVDEAGNAVGIKGQGERDIILLGHMDTVPGQVPIRLEKDCLYGRGAVDAKGPLAAFISAARQVTPVAGTRLIVIGAVEEEAATSKGARHVAQQYRASACVIGEPSGWDAITLGYKGRVLIDYQLTQDMQHTAGPDASVAEVAVTWWQHIKQYSEEFNAPHQKLFDQILPSLRHIQTHSDGLREVAEATVGLRLPPGFDFAAFEAELAKFSAAAQVKCYAFEPAFKGSRSTPLVRAFLKSIRRSDQRPRFKLKTGTSDMNVVGPVWNCPIVAYGAGNSDLDHTPQEHIIISEYLRSIEILQRVLEEICAHER